MHEKYIAPVGWYIASYLLRFVEIDDPLKDDIERKFLSWENTIIIKADSIAEAFDKAVKIAQADTEPYKGGEHGVDVQWVFEGITELLPIYETLEDGSEIMWCERSPRKLKNLRKWLKTKASLMGKDS